MEALKSWIRDISDIVDFGAHACVNIDMSLKVIYLDPAHKHVLVKYRDGNRS